MHEELHWLREKYIQQKIQDSLDYEKFCMISIVYNSSKIEGCSLSETDTRVLLEHNITAQGKPLVDHLMVKDHFEAFQFIKSEAAQKRRLSIDFIKEIGHFVMKNTGGIVRTATGDFDTSKGDLRLSQVYVDKKYFPDYTKVPNLLKQLIENVNQRIDTVKGEEIINLSADIHYNFVNIHPFGDGNGRAARLLMNYVQIYHNEPLIKIFTEDRAEYILALNDTEEKEDLNIFRDFIVRQQIKFYNAELKKFSQKDNGFTLMF
jgi:Fic family protein